MLVYKGLKQGYSRYFSKVSLYSSIDIIMV
jgi:hypothetical protein